MEQENLQNQPEEVTPVKSSLTRTGEVGNLSETNLFNGVKKPIYIFLLVSVVLIVGYYLYMSFYKTNIPVIDDSSKNILDNSQATTTSENNATDKKIGEVNLEEGKSYEYVGADKELIKNTPVPDLNRKIPSGAMEDVKKNITFLSNELKINSGNFDSWIGLGSYRKTAGDYEGAKLAWEYASILRPRFSLSFLNLGNLFGYYLKDSKKAETNFLKAIEVEPTHTYSYISTANFYTEILNDKNKAISILEEGIKNNPNNPDLKLVLTEFKQK
ncbi:MAG: hypothetical protein Athens071416_383 [Parcubacteria group bacterium Athens0714_16]|nr:MAG: hypothetical protein Athens071416_383 [Parcubacteria group bacterium Athens0714_16]